MKKQRSLTVYVWTGFCPDYSSGLAFAVAASLEEAKELVREELGYEPIPWGMLHTFSVEHLEPMAFCVPGGG